MAMLLLLLLLLSVVLIGFRLSQGALQIPHLASRLATAVSGQGISVEMQKADLAWAGYHKGGGVPLYLQLGGISVRNAEGVELVTIPSARLVVLPAALFGGAAPILVSGTNAHFPGSAVPVSLRAAIRLGAGFQLARADLLVTLGPGRLGAGDNSLPITSGGFTLAVTPRAVVLSDGNLHLAKSGESAPLVGFTGHADLQSQWQGSVTATADAVQAGDLAAYWPPTLFWQTRHWVTTNITAGAARDAAFTIALAAPRNLASIAMTSISGGFTGQNLTLTWLPHAAPITELGGRFTVLDQDNALVTATAARLGGLSLSSGNMKILDMNTHRPIGQLSVDVSGTVQDVIAVINAPPLNLLRQAPPEIAPATGAVKATVTATIPLINKLLLEDVTLHVGAALSNVALASPVTGLGFSGGTARLDATTHDIDVAGSAQFAGEPATLQVKASFEQKGAQSFTLSSLAGPVLLHRLGLDVQSVLADQVIGAAPYSVQITGAPAGVQHASVTADLTPLRLAVPRFGWSKPAGVAGQLALSATLNDGNLASLDSISLTAPDLNIQGQAEQNQLTLPVVNIGLTRASGQVIRPTGPDGTWSASFSGPVLDLRAISSSPQKATVPPPANPPGGNVLPSGPAWRLNLNFAQLNLAAKPAPDFKGFVFDGSGQGASLLRAQAKAGDVTLTIAPVSPAQRNLQLQTPDGGFLLGALGAFSYLEGGTLSLDAVYGSGAAVAGKLTLQNFRLLKAPAFTGVMQALTIYGVPDAASGPGLFFERAVVPFSLENDILYLKGARAFSTSLGFTASGHIALADGKSEIDATIIPAYTFNAALGKIPVIGHLFTAEKGGGLFAVRAKISGPLSNPVVVVNPLSALTPGVLRDVFGLGGSPGE